MRAAVERGARHAQVADATVDFYSGLAMPVFASSVMTVARLRMLGRASRPGSHNTTHELGSAARSGDRSLCLVRSAHLHPAAALTH